MREDFITGLCACLVSILGVFALWSLNWTIQGHTERTFGLNQTSTFMLKTSPGTSHESLIASLSTTLKHTHIALIIDTNGDHIPGLFVLDPSGVLPWNYPDTPQEPETSTSASLYLFQGSYSDTTYVHTRTCPLAPPNSAVRGTIAPPPGTQYLQYLYTPHQTDHIPSGRLLLTSTDETLIEDLCLQFRKADIHILQTPNPPLIRELIRNPLILVSLTLYSCGFCFVGIYWNIASLRRQELIIRRSCGASSLRLLKDLVQRKSLDILWGTLVGMMCSMPLVEHVSGSFIGTASVIPSLLAGITSSLLLILLYSALVAYKLTRLSARNVYVS